MKFIEPNVELWKQDDGIEGLWNHIARCTRVCYQSTPKNDGETPEEFVKRVILKHEDNIKNHCSMLEHGTVYLKDEFLGNPDDESYLDKYKTNKYSKVSKFFRPFRTVNGTYVTTNLRVIIENHWEKDLHYICSPTEYHYHRYTFSITTNIGVTREANRHRINSMAEESTRYCNYNKRNDGQINIVLPTWLLDDENMPYVKSHQYDKLSSYCEDVLGSESLIDNWCDIDYYLFSLTVAEFCYNSLIQKGWKPQQAREVLPLATKSQLVHTAFIEDWIRFIKLRSDGVSGSPHPNMKLVGDAIKQSLINEGYNF